LKNKILMLAVLFLVSSAFLYLPALIVNGQTIGTNISSITPDSGDAGAQFNVTVAGTIATTNGSFTVIFGNALAVYAQVNGTVEGNSVNANLVVPVLQPGNYSVSLIDITTASQDSKNFHLVANGIAAIPMAALLIMLVAVAISFINMTLNRALITKMIGWREYRSMQKEISEYNSQRMAALRSKDTKVLEKLKKKESQVQSMQTKMFKPQLILIPITFIYLIIWPALTGIFPFPVAYIPGLGAVPFFYWYLICSFFFGTIASRVIGVTPIQ
jgi:uncharacterized membrane protein (DUF106 family)